MFFNLEDLYVGKIYSLNQLDTNQISDCYAVFYKTENENRENIYILLNRGKINKYNFRFRYGTIFQEINDIDIPTVEDLSFYYVNSLQLLSKKIDTSQLKPVLNLLKIALLLHQINKKEQAKTKKYRNK